MNNLKHIVLTAAENKQVSPLEVNSGAGYRILYFPLIRTEQISVPNRTIINALKANWMIFTSQNAVRYFSDRFDKKNIAEKFSNTSVVAIGARTAALLSSIGIQVRFIPSKSNRKVLSKELPVLQGQRVAVFTSEQTKKQEYNSIIRKGAALDFYFLYRTLPFLYEKKEWIHLFEQRPNAFCFLSSSAVNSFFNQVRSWDIRIQPDNFAWGAIGPETSREIKKWITVPVIQPESTNLKSLLQAVWEVTSTVRED